MKSIDHNIPVGDIPVYIGDGVYVTHDNFQLWLTTMVSEEGRAHQIAIEPQVFRALMEYAERFGDYFTGVKK